MHCQLISPSGQSASAAQSMALDMTAAHKWLAFAFLSLAAYILLAPLAYAQGGSYTPMGNVLCTIIDFIYGNLGRGLCVLAVMVVGVGATLGKVSWGLAVTVAVGISVLFGATNITIRLINGAGNGITSIC